MLDSAFIDSNQIPATNAVFLTKFSGFGSPPSRANRIDKAQRHGQLDFTQFYSGRPLGLEGVVVGATPAAAWAQLDTLKGWLSLGTAHTLIFTRTGFAVAEQCAITVEEFLCEVDIPQRVIPWQVTLVAADPRFYSAALKSGNYDPTLSSTGGGAALPVVFPIVFSTSTVTELILTNNGNFKSPPILTIKGPIVNPIIDNDTTGESITLAATLGSSDVVVIDVNARTVKLNGASRADLLQAQSTTWWEMIPGDNKLRLRGTGALTGITLLTAQFRDARI
jgi:hypothetical protein